MSRGAGWGGGKVMEGGGGQQEQMTKSLERLKETVLETGSKYMDEDMWKD